SPYYIGGRRMANMIIRPSVIDFLDLTVHTGHLDLRIEEVAVSEKAFYCNRSLLDSNIRKDFDLIVVAIKRSDGEMFFNPNFQTTILAGDTLIVLGKLNRINAFVEIS
ncbi:MAG: TrkA family potassium uptake protein, partial [Desulfobulbaceae bacterium]|nr:TrkA family potassium uptake protein [Desulfobulbaceae bacterium]